MEQEQLLKVEETFSGKIEGCKGIETKLDLFKRFYYWLQKQKPKVEDDEEVNKELNDILKVENRLFWHAIEALIESNKQEQKVKLNKLTDNWDTSITKFLYEYMDWYKKNIGSKKIGVSNDVQQSNLNAFRKLLVAAKEADFFQRLYINMQLHVNGILDFKDLAYPKKAKANKKSTPSDEPFLGPDNELFKSEDEHPVFWHCIAKKHVTIQDCIDEDLLLDYLCWPKGSKVYQAFTAALPPMHYMDAKGCGINWENTYKGETLRAINEKIIAKQPKQETKQLNAKEAEEALDGVDVSWLVGMEDEPKHPKVAKPK